MNTYPSSKYKMKTNPLFRCSDVASVLGNDEYRTKDDILKNVIFRRHQASIGKEYPDEVKSLDQEIDKRQNVFSLLEGDTFNAEDIRRSLPEECAELVERTISRKAMEIGKRTEQKIVSEKGISTNPEKKYWKGRYYTLYGIADGILEKDSSVEEVIEIKTRMSDYHLNKEIPLKFWIQLICYMHLYDAKKGILIERFPSGKERRTEVLRKEVQETWDAINKELSQVAQEILSKTQEEIDQICEDLH